MRHWSDDDFLQHLYGLGSRDAHLEDCAECRSRLERYAARRRQTQPPEPAPEFLAAQRRNIHARLDGPFTRWRLGWIHAMAASAAAVVMGLALYRTQPPEGAGVPPPGDALSMEIYLSLAGEAPRAAEPIRGLFEE